MARFEGEYLFAFLAGLFFIALFAWDRLNHRLDADRGHQRQQRFIELLAPSKLLRTAMYVRGWTVYFMLLSLFFFIICSVGEPLVTALLQPHFKQIGFENFDPASPAFPLVVSLFISGVLPHVPFLKRLEEHARRVTHRLVGIPDSFNDLTDALFEQRLSGPLDAAAAARIDETCKAANKALGERTNESQLRANMTKLLSLDWIGEGQNWPRKKIFNQFISISNEIRLQIEAINDDIDDVTARTNDPNQNQDTLAKRWKTVLSRLNSIADDVCALIAIYAENASGLPRSTPADPSERSPVSAQRNALREWILSARRWRDFSQIQFSLLLQNLVFVALALFLIGYAGAALGYLDYPGVEEVGLQRNVQIAVSWLFGTVILYGPTAIIGWGIRLRRIDNGDWPYLDAQDSDLRGVFPWGPYLLLFVCCYITALLSLGLFFLASAYFYATDETIAFRRFVQDGHWRPVFVYAVMGAIYASAMAVFFDLRDTHRSSLRNLLAVSAGFVLLLTMICWFASAYHFGDAWSIVLFHTMAALMFGLTVSLSTILTLRRLDASDRRREDLHKPQLVSSTLTETIA